MSTSTTTTTTTSDPASAPAPGAAGLDEAASSYVSDPETRPVRIQGYPKRRPARDARLAVVPPLGRRRSVAAGPSYGDFFAEASPAASGGSADAGA
ncbi:hypothetical protein [Frigoribacterium endophyticum]|uniref:hypothetical protein n=1 Tax=Frigoribacterium endophyticum TaxID=1522176 RepID=UPI00141FB803|nr:hypothetical protein [Frigoribacterium endophyticum]NII52460.1 hypothetical protein [Frigoribacterium endophyticum]